ncbi:MAG: tripartite tricarboxylate transporter TctB family protein [Tagaea sp.]
MDDEAPRGLVKAPQDLFAGAFLIAFGLFCLWASAGLDLGRGGRLGPGSFPRGLSFLLMGLGGVIAAQSFAIVGPRLESWSIRGMAFLLGAALLFALAIRPLGLAIAGPLALMVSAFASKEAASLGANAVFAAGMTVFCILLFKVALGLPIPVAPWAGW